MKSIFNREQLLAKLKTSINFIPKKAVIPAHEDFFFRISGQVASITALDGEKQMTTHCNLIESQGDVSFCIHARVLLNTLNLFLDEEVSFNVKDAKNQQNFYSVEIKSGKSKYKMLCSDGSAYPLMEPIKSDFEASFSGVSFNTSMETAIKFVSTEGLKPFMQGVCIRMVDSNVFVYATQGFQVVKTSIPARSINKWEDVVIPGQTIKACIKCIADSEIVDITHNKDKVEIKTEDCSIIALAFNLKYPDIEALFRKKPTTNFSANTVQFSKCIERLNLYTEETNPLIKMDIKTTQVVMTAENTSYSRGGDEEFDVICPHEAIVGMNPEYLLNTLSSFTEDEFNLFYSSDGGLIFIEPINTFKDNDKFFVLAPIKTS